MKGKSHPRTGHRSPEGEQRYSSTLSLTSGLDGGTWSTPRPGRFTPQGKKPGTHCVGSWMGPRAGWTGEKNLASTGIQSPDRPALSEWLYRLSYRCPFSFTVTSIKCPSLRLSSSCLPFIFPLLQFFTLNTEHLSPAPPPENPEH